MNAKHSFDSRNLIPRKVVDDATQLQIITSVFDRDLLENKIFHRYSENLKHFPKIETRKLFLKVASSTLIGEG